MMDALQTLTQAAHRLSRDHKSLHIDPITQVATYPTELSLFTQLRIEQESGRRGGGTSGSGSRSPIALSAVILWNEIQEALNTRVIALTGSDAPRASAEEKLDHWVKSVKQSGAPEDEAHCAKALNAWVNAITDLLNPEPRIELTGQCPVCHQTHSWTLDDGEYFRNTALSATIQSANCRACGTEWPRQEFQALAASINQEAA